jgi:phosphohistidine phosphatase
MHLYLAQHGLAVPKEIEQTRPLSDQGREDVARLAALLARAGVRVERVLHSGRARAEQTALLLADRLLTRGEPETHGGLAPDDPVEPLAAELAVWGADTLMVGHLPFLGRLASRLLTLDLERLTLAFQPGALACLERGPAGLWALVWMVRPELLRQGMIDPAKAHAPTEGL